MHDALTNLFDSLPDGAAILGWDCRVLYANPALRAHFGDPTGRMCHEYFHRLDERCPWCPNGDVSKGAWVRRECELRERGLWFDLVEAPIPDAASTSSGGSTVKLVLFRDITGRKRAEEALRRSEEKYRQLVDLAQEGIWTIDAEGRTTFVNPRMAEMLGFAPEEMLGKSLLDHVDPRNAGSAKELMQRRRDGISEQHDFEFLRKDGTVLHASVEAAPILDSEGRFTGALACVADITGRKAAERALRDSERRLSVRNRISEIFLSVPEEQMYGEVLQVLLAELESKYGLFGYIDEDGAMVCPSLTRDVWDQCRMPEKSIVFPREKWGGAWGRALIERRTICANRGPLNVPEGHIGLGRALCVPILYRERLQGLLAVANKETEYGAKDVELLEDVAAKVAVILHSRLEIDRQLRKRRRAEETLATLRRQLRAEPAFAGIVGRDPRMIELFETIREVARVEVPVLIEGESGTGKELVAVAIHNQGPRSDGPFVPVNCSALPESLLESELFGHLKGSFTGAIRDKKGRFELAEGGTLFIDEVGDLTPPIQVKLLRVLQERKIERLGDERSRAIDVRVVSATNKDLRGLVADGRFREDLYYRLCVVPIHTPPLRERRDDIPLLVEHILQQVRADTRRSLDLSSEALDALLVHSWPGNVRELQNAIYYAAVKSRGETLELAHFPPAVVAGASAASRPAARGRKPKLTAGDVEAALRRSEGNKQEAARLLGVSRATLYEHLRRMSRQQGG